MSKSNQKKKDYTCQIEGCGKTTNQLYDINGKWGCIHCKNKTKKQQKIKDKELKANSKKKGVEKVTQPNEIKTKIEEIDIKNLIHFEGNPRFDTVIQEGLFQDIEKNGILVPILVSPAKKAGTYEVIDGERRRISAVELGIPNIVCIVQEMDEKTKWQRAFDLNILNRPFTPMEEAKNYYERKKRFLLSDRNLVDHSTGHIKKSMVSVMVSLNKLPEEIQALVHKKTIGVMAAYELSRLSFDISFPSITKGVAAKQWVAKDPKKNVWDFVGEEPKKWTENRLKLQLDLVKRFIEKRVPANNIESLKNEVNKRIKLEKERRETEEVARQELEEELLELEEKLKPTLETYTKVLMEDLKQIIPDEKKRKESGVNEYLLDSEKIKRFLFESDEKEPENFNDFLYEFIQEIGKEKPSKDRMDVLHAANQEVVSFGKLIKKKSPTVFSVIPDEEKSDFEKGEIIYEPHCPSCGSDVDQEKMDQFNEVVVNSLTKLKDKKELVDQATKRARDVLVDIQSKFIDRINIVKGELDELTLLEEEDQNV